MAAREEWRTVPGYPDYSVSSEGRIVSRRQRGKQHELRPSPVRGYPALRLCNDEGQRRFYVHRIVLLAFVGPLPSGMESRHLDDDPTNNRLSNLAYGTHSDNMFDQVANGTHSTGCRTHCKNGHPFDEANTYRWRDRRYCRACNRDLVQRSKARRAERAA